MFSKLLITWINPWINKSSMKLAAHRFMHARIHLISGFLCQTDLYIAYISILSAICSLALGIHNIRPLITVLQSVIQVHSWFTHVCAAAIRYTQKTISSVLCFQLQSCAVTLSQPLSTKFKKRYGLFHPSEMRQCVIAHRNMMLAAGHKCVIIVAQSCHSCRSLLHELFCIVDIIVEIFKDNKLVSKVVVWKWFHNCGNIDHCNLMIHLEVSVTV